MEKEKPFRHRKLATRVSGAFLLIEDQKFLNFCSHDYLGLVDHPEIKKNAIKHLLEAGVVTPSDAQDLYPFAQKKLEEKLSDLLGGSSTLFFPSRFEANLTLLTTLGHPHATLFLDDTSHLSLMQGAYASQAHVELYSHHQLERLQHLLENVETPTKIIVTESIFSLTGDLAPLSELIELADSYDAILCVDDSHALGLIGHEGMGLCAHLDGIDVITGSFSKACGALGGYICSSEKIRDYCLHLAPTQTAFLFPPPLLGAIEAALDLIPQMEGERKQLEQRSHWLKKALREIGFALPPTSTPLTSLLLNNKEEVDSLRHHLYNEQILSGPTRSFHGEDDSPYLHLAINICHTPDLLSRLVEGMKRWLREPALADIKN